MKKLRIGIAAPGNIARKFAAAAKNLAEVELYAVASRSRERAEAFAEKYEIPLVFDSYEAMAASPEVDCVYVAPPHPFHKEVAEIFLKAKKHVISEKPLCINTAQATALAACAKENGVFLMEAMWTRFLPAIKEVIALVEGGAIGEVRGLTADFCYNISKNEDSKMFKPELAGGGTLDVGVYALHFAAMILGTAVTDISAKGVVEGGCDCHMQALLQYESGAIAAVSSATKLQKPADAYIYGTKGHIKIENFYTADRFTVTRGSKTEELVYPYLGNGFEEEILEAARCIDAGLTESPLHPLSRTLEVVAQMDEIRKKIGVLYPLPGEN